MSQTQKFSRTPFILITSLFLVWGLANNMTDTLLAAFKRIMSMTDFQTSWIQIAFYGSYFCLAIPAALYIKQPIYEELFDLKNDPEESKNLVGDNEYHTILEKFRKRNSELVIEAKGDSSLPNTHIKEMKSKVFRDSITAIYNKLVLK